MFRLDFSPPSNADLLTEARARWAAFQRQFAQTFFSAEHVIALSKNDERFEQYVQYKRNLHDNQINNNNNNNNNDTDDNNGNNNNDTNNNDDNDNDDDDKAGPGCKTPLYDSDDDDPEQQRDCLTGDEQANEHATANAPDTQHEQQQHESDDEFANLIANREVKLRSVLRKRLF